MIKLEDHIVIHSGIKFVPLSIVNQYIEQYTNKELEKSINELMNKFEEIQKELRQDD